MTLKKIDSKQAGTEEMEVDKSKSSTIEKSLTLQLNKSNDSRKDAWA